MLTKLIVLTFFGVAAAQHGQSDDGDDGSYSPEKYELPYINEVSSPTKSDHRPQQIITQYQYKQPQYQQQSQPHHQPQPQRHQSQHQQWVYQPSYNQQSPNYKHAAILSETRYQSTDGKFGSSFTQEDGVEFKEESDHEGNRVGSYSYVDPTGQRRTVTYTAGKGGFQATGAHLPVPVGPVPAAPAAQPQYYQMPYY